MTIRLVNLQEEKGDRDRKEGGETIPIPQLLALGAIDMAE